MNISYDNDIKLDDGFVILSQEIVHSFVTLHICLLCVKVHDLMRKAPVNNIVMVVRDRPFERTLTLHKVM